MSELEIQRRKEYKHNRKKWMIVQLIAIVLLLALAVSFFVVYNRMNRTYYVEYTEAGNIDYQVQYKKNNFFENDWIEKDQTYISYLTERVRASFSYRLEAVSDLDFRYRYQINAKLLVSGKDSGTPYYTYEENILPLKEMTKDKTSNVFVAETVVLDYPKYNQLAQNFIDTYGLESSSTSTLVVTLDIAIVSSNDQFGKETETSYQTALNIPLVEDSYSIFSTSSTLDGEVKALEYQDVADRKVFLILAIVFAVLSVLAMVALFVFMHLTKNEDITYVAKVRKILRTYSAYIQRIDGEFDAEGYQIVMIKTFTEMLGIRDTIQAPVLMSENHDETMTRFLIPTSTSILYVFEIKVDNYDEIYGMDDDDPTDPTDPTEPTEPTEPTDSDENDGGDETESENEVEVCVEQPENVETDNAAPVEEPGVEVIDVVWLERPHRNKVYHYDPDGEMLEKGDIVLVPTYDSSRQEETVREVAVSRENYRIDPELLKHPLKKIIAVVRRNVSRSLTPNANRSEKLAGSTQNP